MAPLALTPIRIRSAEARDLAALSEFGFALARVHAALDPRRFVVPEDGTATFREFFGAELQRPETVILIAEESVPIGYAFLRMEPASLEALCASSAWLHDVFVDPVFRRRGAGRALVAAAIESARSMGSPSLMLGVSPANAQVRRLYERFGLRETMIEMRLDW